MRHFTFTSAATIVIVFASLLLGCHVQDTAAASQVDATITLLDGAASGQKEATGSVYVRVVFNQGGSNLWGSDLTHNESFTCDGKYLSPFDGGPWTFGGAVPDAATVTCAYMRDGTTTHLSFTEPQRLSVLSPKAHGTIAGGRPLVVHFAPALTSAGMSLSAYMSGSPYDQVPSSQQVKASSGSAGVTLPVSDFPQGYPTVYLTVIMSAALATTPSGFHSLTATFVDGVQMPLRFG